MHGATIRVIYTFFNLRCHSPQATALTRELADEDGKCLVNVHPVATAHVDAT